MTSHPSATAGNPQPAPLPDIPMSSQDALWLTMDRPNNLMVIDSLMWFDSAVSKPKLRAIIRERMIRRFPTFSCVPTQTDDGWVWRPLPDFDVDQCLTSVRMPAAAGAAQLRQLVSEQRSIPLPRDRPLWSCLLVTNLTLDDGSKGSAVIIRAHHSLADGVRLTQVMLGMCDMDADAAPVGVGKTLRRSSGPAAVALSAARNLAMDSLDTARSASEQALQGAVRLGSNAPGELFRLATSVGAMVRNPGRISGVLATLGSTDNRAVNDAAAVTKLALSAPSVRTVWSGTPSEAKSAGWGPTLSLPDVKAIGKATGTTVNDVLLGAVAGALTRYLRSHGDDNVDELLWMVPVSVRPLDVDSFSDDEAEAEPGHNNLGNYFALVALRMPIGIDDVATRLAILHTEMARIKASDEALLTFTVQRGISKAPPPAAAALTNFFANKGVGVLTNVPGPRHPMSLAGVTVAGVLAWAPCSGDQVMTICIFSYNGRVSVGFGADATLIPDVDVLADLLALEFDHMRSTILGEPKAV